MTLSFLPRAASAADALGDLVWPSSCAACAAWGGVLCARCCEALRPGHVTMRPVWLPDLTVCSAAVFEGPVRAAITAFKDEGRRDLRRPLASLLRAAIADALRAAPCGVDSWAVIAAPSSRAATRRRGRFPLGELVAQVACDGLAPGPRLVVQRHVRDQSGLSRQARRTNLREAYALTSGASIPPQTGLVLVDDVLTTGATLAEARRAVAPLHPRAVVAATVAAVGGVAAVVPTSVPEAA